MVRLQWLVAFHRGALVVVAAAVVLASGVVGSVAVVARYRHPFAVVGAPVHGATRRAAPRSARPVETPPAGSTTSPGGASGAGAASAPRLADGPGGSGGPSPYSGRGGLLEANGQPFRPAIPFDATIAVPNHLVWVLLVGSDARPGENLLRSRADSIHLVGANPATGQATIVGIPRDSWVPIPGHGVGKINSALVFGGPDLLSDTVHQLTGLPVQLYVVTGFVGMAAMVDAVGGVDVHVDQAMNDTASGAAFQAGWHHMDGGQALAFSRARKSLPGGDFDRSLHQGQVVLAALAKLRSEVGDAAGLQRWLQIGLAHVVLSNAVDTLESLAAAARLTDVSQVRNVVAPGSAGWAGAQSVVYLNGPVLASLVDDLRPDAVIGVAGPAPSTTSSTVPTTSTPSTSTTRPSSTSTTAAPRSG